jgi:hypothetical protein
MKRYLLAFLVLFLCVESAFSQQAGSGAVFSVVEIDFKGPVVGPKDSPARDIDFWARFQHESGQPEYKIHGFWDGDGKGGLTGNVFKIRFSPTRPGKWKIVEVSSNRKELANKRVGQFINASASKNRGFWSVDPESAGRRWYVRSDGTHEYVIGNTQYSFLSGYGPGNKPVGVDVSTDVVRNSEYFKKLRFALHGDRYPHPEIKPFLDNEGRPTDLGDYSHRQNPKWFRDRVDLAIKSGFEKDMIMDLILAGPDHEHSRSTLRARQNNGDPTPWLKYVAARYGSYPNVWICLANEYDILTPCKNADAKSDCEGLAYSADQIIKFGQVISTYLPYKNPLSVHSSGRGFLVPEVFDKGIDWHTHQIIQKKQKTIPVAADTIDTVWKNGGKQPRNKPTINDELSYQGEGDKHTEEDTIESHLGAFLGGGYGSTGWKSANKIGHYFAGKFDPAEHTSADNLKFLRETINRNVSFWKMSPDLSIFANLDPDYRGLAWSGNEYILGTGKAREGIVANLPAGQWDVVQYNIITKEAKPLGRAVSGKYTFAAPESRAVIFHFKKSGNTQASKNR